MDTGEGRFEPCIDEENTKKLLNDFPNHGGFFKIGEIVELKGSKFRVKSVKPKELRLKLLPK